MQPKLAKVPEVCLEDIFKENYSAMKRWADIIVRNDRTMSEDLVHDVFVKCSRTSSDLSQVEDIKGFLFTAIRNTYLSQVRRRTHRRETPITDEMQQNSTSLMHDPRKSGDARDQLFDICYFACNRKDKSISASVLLLRYFHGYNTAEAKKILKRSQNSVEARMSKIRAEVMEYRCRFERIDRFASYQRDERANRDPFVIDNELIIELRSLIFSYRSGRCLTSDQWRKLYLKCPEIDRQELSHLVSCPDCLDAVNELLRLPPLSHRHPLDSCHVHTTSALWEGTKNIVLAVATGLITAVIDLNAISNVDLLT